MFSASQFIKSLCLLALASASFANDDIKIDPMLFNPASRFVNQEQWERIVDESLESKQNNLIRERRFGTAKVITVDTRDQEACRRVESELNQFSNSNNIVYDLCKYNSNSPYSTVTVYDNPYESKGISYNNLNKKTKNIVDQTRNLSVLGLGVIGAIWLLPEDVSNWSEEKVGKKFGDKYLEHVTNPPIMDNDSPLINFIGHPYSGAIYYTVARHAGLSKMQSFGYSVFMSTAFWEYGVEAIFEEPSIQDLIITPILGSLLGALFESYTDSIKKNKGKVLGSEMLGSVLMTIMNPTQEILESMNNFFETEYIKDVRTYFYTKPRNFRDDNFKNAFEDESFLGIGIEFKF